jgi:hypothetical protein
MPNRAGSVIGTGMTDSAIPCGFSSFTFPAQSPTPLSSRAMGFRLHLTFFPDHHEVSTFRQESNHSVKRLHAANRESASPEDGMQFPP